MSLRDDLAKRLASLLDGAIVHTETTPEGFPGMTYADLSPLADECIRQMEWASKESIKRPITEPIDCSDYPGMRGIRILGMRPLTLAPEDWKP